MHVQFMGAARTVTGSCYIVEAAGTRFAVDCGMSQGNSEMEKRNFATEAYRPGDIAFILLTHAHIDHSGLLPRIVRDGFRGLIHCTAPTVDLVAMMLEDSAHIQETEAAWHKKDKERHGDQDPADPLYTIEDARRVPEQLSVVEYDTPFSPHPGITVCYRDAGHILGAALLEILIEEDGKTTRLVFSGDLGRPGTLLMHDPSIPVHADYLFLESTYGDRNHKNEDDSLDELHQAILYAHGNHEKVIIPAFAVGRTQEILYSLFLLHQQERLPANLPVYVDSPLAIRATEIFARYRDFLYMPELGDGPFTLPDLHFTLSTHESQALNASTGPGVIIAASGMCNAGRIRHHLRHNAWKPGAAIVFVGYQGMSTTGRRIVDGAKSVRLFGQDVAVKARIFTIGGFSAHAGQNQLLGWVEAMLQPTMQVVLVHGEDRAIETLSGLIRERFGLETVIPDYLQEISLEPGAARLAERLVQRAEPSRINWDTVISSTEAHLDALRKQLASIPDKPWNEQVELRDRLLELNKELLTLLSTM